MSTFPYKRPGSPHTDYPGPPPAKIPKTTFGQFQINYLKREKKDTIPLATAEEPLPRLLRIISEYDGVLQRNESLAGNLGACPVGPIMYKRFERLFEGPPRILKANSRDPNITWLDVVEFAQNKPEQFDLEKTRNGIRVCQFYVKQCRVEISEEDFVLIRSGLPQKLIPPQPILEDEEKELGVIEVLDRNVGKIIHTADQVSARARQLVHRLKSRRTAILARRETEGDAHKSVLKSNDIPTPASLGIPVHPESSHNGSLSNAPTVPPAAQSPSLPSTGFTAVNPRHSITMSDAPPLPSASAPTPSSASYPVASPFASVHDRPGDRLLNGTPPNQHAQHAQHSPLQEHKTSTGGPEDRMNKFLTPSERAAGMTADTIRRETFAAAQRSASRGETAGSIDDSMRLAGLSGRRQDARRQSEGAIPDRMTDVQGPSVAIPNTPASLIPQQKPHTWNRDDGGPYKAEMISRMETMKRGERVIPPCDRCRRLHMDCIKNLTACLGCTKKHAKCSWKDVSLEELESTAPAAKERAEKEIEPNAPTSSDWDDMLKRTKTDVTDPSRVSPATTAAAASDTGVKSNKASTPRMPSPPQNGHSRIPSHAHESPSFDVRPPPLDQQLRDAASDQHKPPSLPPQPTSRFSPFQRPASAQQSPTFARPKEDQVSDEGDRLATIAAQVYRTSSQNTARATETRNSEQPS